MHWRLCMLYAIMLSCTRTGSPTLVLQALHASGILFSFAIDEAHCVTSWGERWKHTCSCKVSCALKHRDCCQLRHRPRLRLPCLLCSLLSHDSWPQAMTSGRHTCT